jgi:hypothetical protein
MYRGTILLIMRSLEAFNIIMRLDTLIVGSGYCRQLPFINWLRMLPPLKEPPIILACNTIVLQTIVLSPEI